MELFLFVADDLQPGSRVLLPPAEPVQQVQGGRGAQAQTPTRFEGKLASLHCPSIHLQGVSLKKSLKFTLNLMIYI